MTIADPVDPPIYDKETHPGPERLRWVSGYLPAAKQLLGNRLLLSRCTLAPRELVEEITVVIRPPRHVGLGLRCLSHRRLCFRKWHRESARRLLSFRPVRSNSVVLPLKVGSELRIKDGIGPLGEGVKMAETVVQDQVFDGSHPVGHPCVATLRGANPNCLHAAMKRRLSRRMSMRRANSR